MVGEDTEPTGISWQKRMKNNTTGEYFVEEADPPFEENVKGKRAALSGGISGRERLSCFDLQISVSGIRCRYGSGDPGAAQAESEYRDQAGGAGTLTNYATRRAGTLIFAG